MRCFAVHTAAMTRERNASFFRACLPRTSTVLSVIGIARALTVLLLPSAKPRRTASPRTDGSHAIAERSCGRPRCQWPVARGTIGHADTVPPPHINQLRIRQARLEGVDPPLNQPGSRRRVCPDVRRARGRRRRLHPRRAGGADRRCCASRALGNDRGRDLHRDRKHGDDPWHSAHPPLGRTASEGSQARVVKATSRSWRTVVAPFSRRLMRCDPVRANALSRQ